MRHTSKVFFFNGEFSYDSETWLELIVLEIERKKPLLPDVKFATISCSWRRRYAADQNKINKVEKLENPKRQKKREKNEKKKKKKKEKKNRKHTKN